MNKGAFRPGRCSRTTPTTRAPARARRPDKFRVVRVDTDSNGIKAYQFAGNVSRSRTGGQKYSGATPDGYALPALNTGGFAISKNGRATDMASTIDAAEHYPERRRSAPTGCR